MDREGGTPLAGWTAQLLFNHPTIFLRAIRLVSLS